MAQDQDSKFESQYFSTPNLFSSHLSKILDQTSLYSNFNTSEIGKISSQYDKIAAIPEFYKLTKDLLESINNTKGLFADSGFSKAYLKTQNMTERFTGIAKISQSFLESQNSMRGVFADPGIRKGLLESISSTKGVFAESKLKELFRGEELKQFTGYKNEIDTLYGFTKTLEIEGLTRSSLSKFALEDVGRLISLSDNYRNLLLKEFDGLSSSYSRLAKLRNTEVLNAFPANLFLEYPALEILESTNLIEVITEEDSDQKLES
ncbi:MAG: hypothetical protein ACRC80_32010, partial [Waterburya sp.]